MKLASSSNHPLNIQGKNFIIVLLWGINVATTFYFAPPLKLIFTLLEINDADGIK